MKTTINRGGVAYSTPAVTLAEFSSEGILCVSFTNEAFTAGEDNAATYGNGQDNNGWF